MSGSSDSKRILEEQGQDNIGWSSSAAHLLLMILLLSHLTEQSIFS